MPRDNPGEPVKSRGNTMEYNLSNEINASVEFANVGESDYDAIPVAWFNLLIDANEYAERGNKRCKGKGKYIVIDWTDS